MNKLTLFNILIIGRSNVGKSTLFNRLLNRTKSITDNNPGTTRDFKYVDFYLNDLLVRLYDTAGCDLLSPESFLQKDIMYINENLLKDADLILFVVDSKNGLTSNDIEFANYLKFFFFKTFLISNKHDSRKALEGFWEPLSLGLKYSFPISAAHGLGIDDLKKEILRFLKLKQPSISEDNESSLEINWNRKKNIADPYSTLIKEKQLNSKNEPIKLAIVGRPNVGKSTLLNSMIKKQRVLTSSKSGTTTDPILVDLNWMGQEFKIIDTAGIRRSSKIQKGIEELSLPQFGNISFVTISALRNEGTEKLYSAILDAKKNWQKRFATSKLNKWLEIKTSEYPPPMLKGRRLRLRYITQIKSRPPNFLIFSSSLDVPKNYRRFLFNSIREQFNLKNIPIRLKFKVGNNPYVKY